MNPTENRQKIKKKEKKEKAKESSDGKGKRIKKGTNIMLIPINIRPIL